MKEYDVYSHVHFYGFDVQKGGNWGPPTRESTTYTPLSGGGWGMASQHQSGGGWGMASQHQSGGGWIFKK